MIEIWISFFFLGGLVTIWKPRFAQETNCSYVYSQPTSCHLGTGNLLTHTSDLTSPLCHPLRERGLIPRNYFMFVHWSAILVCHIEYLIELPKDFRFSPRNSSAEFTNLFDYSHTMTANSLVPRTANSISRSLFIKRKTANGFFRICYRL